MPKISEFKPSAQRLFTLMGREEWIKNGVDARNEIYTVASRITELRNDIYGKVGQSAFNDINVPWPINAQIAEVIRLCIREYPDTYVSEEFSRFLLRCGFGDREIISALGTWDKLMFSWQESGMTVSRLESMLQEAGLPYKISATARDKLERWIERPISAAFTAYENFENQFLEAVFSGRCFSATLDTEYDADPGELFSLLFTGLDIRERLTSVSHCYDWHWSEDRVALYRRLQNTDSEQWQPFYSDGESLVYCVFDEVEYVFFTGQEERSVNERSVLSNFDAFMSLLNRRERAFRIKLHKHWDEGGHFIVGDPEKLRKLMVWLGFEGLRASPETNTCFDFKLGNGPTTYSYAATVHCCLFTNKTNGIDNGL